MKRRGEPEGDLSGFLDQDTQLKGEIAFKDTLRIDGKFEGSIRAGKSLVVGETAQVNAEIEVGSLYVSGRLQGTVRANERVELLRTARVASDVSTPVLVVEEGAILEGRCSMQVGPREVERAEVDKTDKNVVFKMK